MCQSITGPLRNWNARDWKKATGYIRKDGGGKYTGEELRAAFVAELAKGHEVVPIGDCDNFDFKTGCRGHPILENIGSQRTRPAVSENQNAEAPTTEPRPGSL